MVVKAKSIKTQFKSKMENGRFFNGLEAFPSVDKVTLSFYEDDSDEKSAPIAQAELDLICVDQLPDADACGLGVFDDDTVDAFFEVEESHNPLVTKPEEVCGLFYADAFLKSLYVDESVDDRLAFQILKEMDWLLQFMLNIDLRNLIVKINPDEPDYEKHLLELFMQNFIVLTKEPMYLVRNYRVFP